jgi:predicted nucleotidyltransferase
MLKRLFSSKTRVNLLTLFLSNPEQMYFAREIERLTGDDFHGIVRELKNLEKMGLLTGKKDKNRIQYYVNKKFPIYDEIKTIFFKTVGLEGLLKEKLSKFSGIEMAFIYGSYAKGEENSESDIDLLIVGNVNDMKLSEAIRVVEKQLNREINYIVYNRGEFNRRRKEGDGFLLRVLKDKRIILKG